MAQHLVRGDGRDAERACALVETRLDRLLRALEIGSHRFLELRLEFRRNLEGFVRFTGKNSHDGTFGQGIPLHDDLSAYDSSGR